jgi:DAK2 domain fusion protein YloV
VTDTNLVRFRAAVAAALAHLESRRQEVNDLNVFPVADGDTGDNMALTLRAVVDELDRLLEGDDRTIDEIGREEIVHSVARAALLGARGNSGVILSQLIRGAAEELVSRPGQLIDAPLIGAALSHAADRAYASVRDPAEGTILTVAREMAHQIVTDVAHSDEHPRLSPATASEEQDSAIAAALERAVMAGEQSVKRGPELLAALRDAGVVDAGGYGLTIIFAGVVAALRGEEAPKLDHHAPARITHPEHTSGTYRFCTNFAVTGAGLQAHSFVAELEEMGDSVLVVGDEETLKVHLHTDDPERATAVFALAGEVSRIDIADMRAQVAERDARLGPGGDGSSAAPDHSAAAPPASAHGDAQGARCAAVAVVNGDGLREIFRELGVHTIDGGPTMNPSTFDLLAGIHEVRAEEVVLLPNSANVIMAAEHAARLSDKAVLVAPTDSQQAGLAGALALAFDRSVEENGQAVSEALASIRTAAVAEAARDDAQGRFHAGEAVGFVDDEVVAWGDPADTLRAALALLQAGEDGDAPELISVIEGERAPLALAEVAALLDGPVELELRRGGQSAYWWLLLAE